MSRRVLFATSNGTGLGHLNRAMAIARRLPDDFEPSFLTLSQAAPVVAAQGYEVDYLASYRRPASGTDRAWNLRLRAVLELILDERRPDLVVFDGVHPYRALTHVLSARGAPRSLWCRRAMWRAGSGEAPLRRAGAFDAVLEPGELAEGADRGPTVIRRASAARVAPIVLLDEGELLDRERAAEALGLDPSRRTALVALGQGQGLRDAQETALHVLGSRGDLQVAVLRSDLAERTELAAGVVAIDGTYPISRLYRAFDFAVAAPGYNAFHELIAHAVPTLCVPMTRETDDQAARARWAAAAGVGLEVAGAGDPQLAPRLAELAEPEVSDRLRGRCREVSRGNGAAAAADLVAAMARGGGNAPATRETGRLNRWLRLSAHPVGPTLPLVLALGGRSLLRHPERRAPRLMILALGVPEAELRERLGSAIGPLDPARVLVVTDSLDFTMLRELGVAFELLPAIEGGRAPTVPERDALADRLRALTRGRKPLRAVAIGAPAEEILRG